MSAQSQVIEFDFTSSLKRTLERFDNLSDGKRGDYDRAKKQAEKVESETFSVPEKTVAD